MRSPGLLISLLKLREGRGLFGPGRLEAGALDEPVEIVLGLRGVSVVDADLPPEEEGVADAYVRDREPIRTEVPAAVVEGGVQEAESGVIPLFVVERRLLQVLVRLEVPVPRVARAVERQSRAVDDATYRRTSVWGKVSVASA